MRQSWQGISTRTIDLGYEQLLIVSEVSGGRTRALFRGEWLGTVSSAQQAVKPAHDEVRAATPAGNGRLQWVVGRTIPRESSTARHAPHGCPAPGFA